MKIPNSPGLSVNIKKEYLQNHQEINKNFLKIFVYLILIMMINFPNKSLRRTYSCQKRSNKDEINQYLN